jgi:DNA-binding NtrC family response regulator
LARIDGGGACILIVEDEAVSALAIEQILLAHGYDVCGIAATGHDARALARSARPALALIDVRLKDGVIGHIAAHDIQTQLGIPVVLMSGHSDESCARQAGVVGFLPKPFGDHQLLRLIDAALRTVRTNKASCPIPGLLVPNHFVAP